MEYRTYTQGLRAIRERGVRRNATDMKHLESGLRELDQRKEITREAFPMHQLGKLVIAPSSLRTRLFARETRSARVRDGEIKTV